MSELTWLSLVVPFAQTIGELRGNLVDFDNTYSFQTPRFYRRQGYVTVDVIQGFPGGIRKIFLKKQLV